MNILTCYVGHKTSNDVKSLFIIFNKAIQYIEDDDSKCNNGIKYITPIPDNKESGNTLKNREIWNKLRYLVSLEGGRMIIFVIVDA